VDTDTYFEIRKKLIEFIYLGCMGRQPDKAGLENYLNEMSSIEKVYDTLYHSEEAVNYRKNLEDARNSNVEKLPMTLAIFVKDNESSLELVINSVKSIVSEIVVLDTGSLDNTVAIAEASGAAVYKCGFTNFGDIRTVAAHLSTQPWILMLDSDELILEEDLVKFKELVEDKTADAWALPRKRWLELEMKTQLEPEVYPDWQVRLFRNVPYIKFERRVHEVIKGPKCLKHAEDGPTIQHFQDCFKQGPVLEIRNSLYKKLQELDIKEGIEHTEKAFEDLDV
jgi:hypothetical protein